MWPFIWNLAAVLFGGWSVSDTDNLVLMIIMAALMVVIGVTTSLHDYVQYRLARSERS